ncbi:ribosome recycling factor [Candidatus Peregrinibacteria bacterium]|nr:ribosome recycling factor [Candidatus Peregrinibacteria bacterium]
MTTDQTLNQAEQDFQKIVAHLKDEFSRLQMGRANPAMVENISVEAYGVSQPLKAVASIAVPEPRTLVIQPWDRSVIVAIEKGIMAAGIGLNPINDGVAVRINIPPLTEERRIELTKHVKKLAEEARISVRNARQDAHNVLKEMKSNDQITEDDWYEADEKLQEKVNKVNQDIDKVAEVKEKDVMTV